MLSVFHLLLLLNYDIDEYLINATFFEPQNVFLMSIICLFHFGCMVFKARQLTVLASKAVVIQIRNYCLNARSIDILQVVEKMTRLCPFCKCIFIPLLFKFLPFFFFVFFYADEMKHPSQFWKLNFDL